MSKCTSCGANFVGAPESMPPDGLCRSCQIEALKKELADLRHQVQLDTGNIERIRAQGERDAAEVEVLRNQLRVAKDLLECISKDTVLVGGQKYFPTARAEAAREALSQLNGVEAKK